MKDSQIPSESPRPVGLMQALLEVRAQLLAGRPIWFFTNGGETAEHFMAFIEGFVRCMDLNRIPDDGFEAFLVWLRDVKRELPPEGWASKYLKDCGGDHLRAILKYLDLLAEYANGRGGPVPEGQ